MKRVTLTFDNGPEAAVTYAVLDKLKKRGIKAVFFEIGAFAHADKLFRPFGGGGAISERLLNKRCLDHLKSGGYSCVPWNNVTGDWKDPDGWVDTALETLGNQDWLVIVIHDMDTGAMKNLSRFLDQLDAIGVEYRQDFPNDCMPMVRGEVVHDMTGYVSAHI